MKRRKRKKPTVDLGVWVELVENTIMKHGFGLVEGEHEAIEKEIRETKESIDRGPRIVRPNHKLKL